jgi:hypothetical protein
MKRFEGAITTPEQAADSTIEPVPARPPRPAIIEFSAAILVVGGLFALFGTLAGVVSQGAESQIPPVFVVLFVVLDVLTVAVGLLIRMGRSWVLAINVVAISLFLDLTALPSPVAVLFATMDAFVFFALFRHRWWFDWRPEPRGG